MRLSGRIKRLERHPHYVIPEPIRLVISQSGKDLNLATSTCRRTVDERGLLVEIVDLDGCRDDVSDEALAAFIERFPIQRDVK